MPRSPRLLLSKSYYHIITRGNNRLKVFKSDNDYQYYLELINKYKAIHPFDLFHYCLMPNHVHLMVRTNKATNFSVFMKKVNLAYFHHYRQSYSWIGHFWQDRFKSQPIGKDEHFIQCGKYIELNPVRAEIVMKPEDYRYSSYHFYTLGIKNKLITQDFLYVGLGNNPHERQQSYQKLIIAEAIQESYNKTVWGSNKQRHNEIKKISNCLNRRLAKQKHTNS